MFLLFRRVSEEYETKRNPSRPDLKTIWRLSCSQAQELDIVNYSVTAFNGAWFYDEGLVCRSLLSEVQFLGLVSTYDKGHCKV